MPHRRVPYREQLLPRPAPVVRPPATERALRIIAPRLARLFLILTRRIKVFEGAGNGVWVAWRDERAVDTVPDLERDAAGTRGNDPARLMNCFGDLSNIRLRCG